MTRYLKTAYATSEVIAHTYVPRGTLSKQAQTFQGFDFEPREGYLYVTVRAVSARVNKNYDGFTADELERSYKTFEGRPVFVNHENTDIRRARGVIIGSKLHKDNPRDVWVEVLMEMDERTYPKLCHYIRTGELDTVSMGCNIQYSDCSVCGNRAYTPIQYCAHIKNKGVAYERKTASGQTQKVLAYEDCRGVDFFEESWVFDPADSSAMVQALMKEGSVAQRNAQTHRPEPVDTLRDDSMCPNCGSIEFDGTVCEVCGFIAMPEGMDDPDTEKAKEVELPIEEVEPTSVADEQVEVEAMRRRAVKWDSQGLCASCDGTGQCSTCEGSGVNLSDSNKCGRCRGTGVCQSCDGQCQKSSMMRRVVLSPTANEGVSTSPKKGGNVMARRTINDMKRVANRHPRRVGQAVGEAPIAAPAETTVDESADARIDVTAPVITEVPPAVVNEVALPETSSLSEVPETAAEQVNPAIGEAIARRRQQIARRRAMMREGQTVEGPQETPAVDSAPQPATDANPPLPAPAETTVDTSADAQIDVTAPVISEVPAAAVNEIDLPAPAEPVGAPADQMGGGPIQNSVTAARVAFVKAYKLAELRQEMGLEDGSVEKTVMADRLSRKHTVRELDVAIGTLMEVKASRDNASAPRSAVPRRRTASMRSASFAGTRTASSSIPDEAIFGL